jgi:beta-xylosidase
MAMSVAMASAVPTPAPASTEGAPAVVASTTATTAATTETTTTTTAVADGPGVVVTPGEEVPNPFVLVGDGTYYLYSSQPNIYAEDLPVRTSTDRVRWSEPVDAMPSAPSWAYPGWTWAPDVRRIGRTYVAWYTAAALPLNPPGVHPTMCIGVATAPSPLGPFTHVGDAPAICQRERLGSIDPRMFLDADGELWLHWKSDDNADVTGGHGTPSIYAQRLSSDGLTLVGDAVRILEVDQAWEGPIVEAPQLVLVDGRYWLFYSGNWFNQPHYGIGVASCEGPAGPCTKPFDGPWLGSNAQGSGPGEASLFVDDDGWWMTYHPTAALDEGNLGRSAALAHLRFTDAGPELVPPSDWPG